MDRTPTPPRTTSTARLQKRTRKRSPASVKNAWLITAIAVVFLIGVVWSAGPQRTIEFLYEPTAIVILVLVLLEYIVLKGRDRSRIYRIELEKMRDKRHQDIEFLRELEAVLAALEKDLESLGAVIPENAMGVAELIVARNRLASLRDALVRNL
jgi:hypothetical protein